MFFKIGVLRNFAIFKRKHLDPLFNKVAGLAAINFTQKRLQHRCFLVNIPKFSRTTFFIEHHRWMSLLVWSSNCSVTSIYRSSLLHQKHDVGWFLLKRFVDLLSYSSLVETFQKRFYWLMCRKQKLVQSKALHERLFVLILEF